MSRGRRAALLAALAVLPFAVRAPAPPMGDDWIHLERARAVLAGDWRVLLDGWVLAAPDAATWWTPADLRVPYFRPLVSLSFVVDEALWGGAPLGLHATNLALHAVATLLVASIGRRLLGSAPAAFVAAALFAVHPAHGEAVLWASGRTDVLAAVLFLGAFRVALDDRLLATAALAFLAVGAKEMAITLPVVVALQRRWKGTLGAAIGVGAAFAFRFAWMGAMAAPPHPFVHGPGDPDFAWNVVGSALVYLADLVLVAPTDPAEGFPLLTRFWPVLLAMAGVAALGVARLARSAPSRVATFSLAWMAITVLPVLPASVGERFLYLPSVGLCLLFGAAVLERRAVIGVVTAAAVVSLVKALIWAEFARVARKPMDEALAAVDAAPAATRVLVVDLPAASFLGFGSALRLARPDRHLQVEILSVAPHFLAPNPAFSSEATRDGDALTVRATGLPYLTHYLERAVRGEGGPLATGEVVERPGFRVRVDDASDAGLVAFTATLDPGEAGRTVLLRGEGYAVAPW